MSGLENTGFSDSGFSTVNTAKRPKAFTPLYWEDWPTSTLDEIAGDCPQGQRLLLVLWRMRSFLWSPPRRTLDTLMSSSATLEASLTRG